MKVKQKTFLAAGLLALCMAAIFGPDLPSSDSSGSLLADSEEAHRRLQGTCDISTPGKVIESTEDFEDGLYPGWSLAGISDPPLGVDASHPESFTSFLGRFGRGQTVSKSYPITAGATGAQVSFTFYEIDSWDADDKMLTYINGVELDMGPFQFETNEGTRSGEVNGIKWTATTNAPPASLGFNRVWVGDQMHYITIDVPQAQLPSASLEFGVQLFTDEPINNESGGIDNIMVIACPPPAFAAGVNGDPLIMGLSGQLFNFDGRSGAWYSAVSTQSFQWNLRVQTYETCPSHSDNFVSGAAFAFYNKNGRKTSSIEVNVVDPHHVDVGCDKTSEEANCLGAGSLELVIDGIKHSVGGNFKTKDGAARILAFNTFYQCSRRWFDFEVLPSSSSEEQDEEEEAVSLRSGRRRLKAESIDVFDVIEGIKDTMIDHEVCEEWIQDRKTFGDLFLQAGHYSTIIIQSKDINLHLEYKQENERCNAHSVDVWISSVSESLLDEKWDGVIGETKNLTYVSDGEHTMIDRVDALKHASDKAYEVKTALSDKCRGCTARSKNQGQASKPTAKQ